MKEVTEISRELVARAYEQYHMQVYLYIYKRINKAEDAEDLVQDVFLRMMGCDMALCEATIKHFIYTIAHNLVNDYLRHTYRTREFDAYMFDHTSVSSADTESRIIADDLA